MREKTTEPKQPKLKIVPGQTADVAITSLDEEGYGCGTIDGIPVSVMGTLPGEQARVKITHSTRNRAYGMLLKIVRHSPARLKVLPCKSAPECDACPLIPMKYPAQLEWKQNLLIREIGKFFPLDTVDIPQIIPSPQALNYRNSAKMVIGGKHASPLIGIYRRNTHDIIDISDCALHHPLINKIVLATKEGIRKGKVPIYSPRSESGLLRYLVVRISQETNRAMVIFVTTQRSFNEIHHLAKHLQSAVPEVSVVGQNINTSTGNVILGNKDHFLTKEQSLTDSIGPIRFTISPRSFFQINSGGARIIYEKVRELAHLSGQERVLDLFCGVGGISLFVANKSRNVMGIEYVAAAVRDAERNAELNGVQNCRFTAGDAADLLTELAAQQEKFDVVVLNPPRKGCDERVLKKVAELEPSRMIYVSCSPSSLARDLSILHRCGYRPQTIQPIDMFPQTTHMENVALIVPNRG